LKEGKIVHADTPTVLPFWIRALTSFPLRLGQPLVLAALVAFGLAVLVFGTSSSDCDSATPSELPMTRVTKFTISPRTTAGSTNRREWTRVTNDRWVERYVDDGFSIQFNLKCRTTLQGCPGTVVYEHQKPAVRRFIPDKGCEGMPFWLREGDGDWGVAGSLTLQD